MYLQMICINTIDVDRIYILQFKWLINYILLTTNKNDYKTSKIRYFNVFNNIIYFVNKKKTCITTF